MTTNKMIEIHNVTSTETTPLPHFTDEIRPFLPRLTPEQLLSLIEVLYDEAIDEICLDHVSTDVEDTTEVADEIAYPLKQVMDSIRQHLIR